MSNVLAMTLIGGPRRTVERTSFEVDVDEIGPSLKYATAKVNKTTRGGGGGGAGGGGGFGSSGSQPAGDDSWASPPPASSGGFSDEPPF